MPFNQAGSGGASTSILQQGTTALTSGDLTTASTTFVNATGVAVTITTGAHRCLVIFSGAGQNNTSGDHICVDLLIDAARQGQTFGLTASQSNATGAQNNNLSFSFMTGVLTAAAHTFQLQYRADAGTAKLYASTTVTPAILTVMELGLTT